MDGARERGNRDKRSYHHCMIYIFVHKVRIVWIFVRIDQSNFNRTKERVSEWLWLLSKCTINFDLLENECGIKKNEERKTHNDINGEWWNVTMQQLNRIAEEATATATTKNCQHILRTYAIICKIALSWKCWETWLEQEMNKHRNKRGKTKKKNRTHNVAMQKILPKQNAREKRKNMCRRLDANESNWVAKKKNQPAEWKHCWSTLNARFASPKTRKHCVSVRCVFALALNIAPCSRCARARTLRESVGHTEQDRKRKSVLLCILLPERSEIIFFFTGRFATSTTWYEKIASDKQKWKTNIYQTSERDTQKRSRVFLECYSLCGIHK